MPAGLQRRVLRRIKRLFRIPVWPTKSFEFWTLLMVMLQVLRPRDIAEFGSGRSSSFLGEYAMKTGARYVSVEESTRYALMMTGALTLGLVDPAPIRLVPLRADGWYDQVALERTIDFQPDMLFIDGPTKVAGHRSIERAMAMHRRLLPTVRLLVVDDVHRHDVLELHQALAELMSGVRTLYMVYGKHANLIAVTMPDADCDRVESLASALDIPLVHPSRIAAYVTE